MLSLMQLFEFRIKLFVFGMTFWEGEIFIGMKGRERDKRWRVGYVGERTANSEIKQGGLFGIWW